MFKINRRKQFLRFVFVWQIVSSNGRIITITISDLYLLCAHIFVSFEWVLGRSHDNKLHYLIYILHFTDALFYRICVQVCRTRMLLIKWQRNMTNKVLCHRSKEQAHFWDTIEFTVFDLIQRCQTFFTWLFCVLIVFALTLCIWCTIFFLQKHNLVRTKLSH